MTVRTLVVGGILIELALLSFYVVPGTAVEVLHFIVVHALVFGIGAFLFYHARASSPGANEGTRRLVLILGFAVVFRLTLVPHAPVASDDIYRYLWDGKVAANGINPFELAPNDSRLEHLHSEELPARVSFPEMRTIYPPFAQAVFLGSHVVFGESVSGLKVLLILADVAAMFLMVLLLRRIGGQPEQVLLYAWSPLPIMYFGLDGHVDALGIPFLFLMFLLLLRGKAIGGALSLGAAVLSKLHPLFLAPLLVREVKGWQRIVVPVVPFLMLLAGALFFFEPSGGLYESLLVFGSRWEFNGSLFPLLHMLLGSNELAHLACWVLFAGWTGWLVVTDRLFLEKVFLAFLGFFIIAPVVHPWYLTWLAALLVYRWSLAVFVFLGLSSLSNIVVF
ncbi:MAG: hypothetical protein KAJ12_12525, partial [Bacteroidetes bacterium]|nr:hypothetical protein [Bacteroidota bacterium]